MPERFMSLSEGQLYLARLQDEETFYRNGNPMVMGGVFPVAVDHTGEPRRLLMRVFQVRVPYTGLRGWLSLGEGDDQPVLMKWYRDHREVGVVGSKSALKYLAREVQRAQRVAQTRSNVPVKS